MSHNTGTVQTVAPVFQIGPDTGMPASMPNTWARQFPHTPAPGGSRFVILHFSNVSLPANNRLEVDLGYGTDVFTAADGNAFWTRPVDIHALPGGEVPIRYITDGAGTGIAEIDKYGRGESLPGDPGHPSISNSDPFLPAGSYSEPTYDPFWFCDPAPDWENVGCIPGGDIRAQVTPSVGMIVTVHGTSVSTCSVTCIGPDLVITAGHCLEDPDNEVPSSSVIFNYATDCGGNAPGYAGKFFKVKALKKYRWDPGVQDYAILQLKVPPGGIGVPVIAMRPSLPAVGEQVFGIHHPNGAIKKLSRPHPGYTTVGSAGTFIHVEDLDVSGGSSGSGLFDTSGRFLGVLSFGGSCSLNYYSSASILQDIAATPAPPDTRHVMIVFDRSGSMSASAGTGLGSKIAEARDAASLFVQLIRTGGGNRIGLVSFSTSANDPADFPLAAATNNAKNDLIGPAPYSGGIVGGLNPNGMTSIGDGLEVARDELAGGGGNDTILLLTDGLQNTPPMIQTVAPTLGGIDLHAIGFGTEASLDGTLLNQLAQSHNGMYTRAGSGLELKKFFALAFGNIFEAGALSDPEFVLAAGQNEAKPVPVSVCGEEVVTAVVGWERPETPLGVRLESPGGLSITAASPGVEHASGRTWTFLRLPLPHGGERDGTWQVIVFRPAVGGGEFATASSSRPVRYFVNVLAKGGPLLRNRTERRRYYTGDAITPRVLLQYADGRHPHHGKVGLVVDRPAISAGTTLVRSQRVPPATVDADTIPARFASLMALEQAAGEPLVKFQQESHTLISGPANTGGLFETPGVFGKHLDDALTVEGNYRFHAKASYGEDCQATRELIWSVHVETGIDPANTEVRTDILATLPDGRRKVRVTLTPRDRFGNHLGPGKGEGLTLQPLPGSTPVHGLADQGDGSYQTVVLWDPDSGQAPGVIVAQPERPPAIVSDPSRLPPHRHLPWWLLWLLLLIILVLVVLLIA